MNTVPILQGGCGAISTTAARVPCAAQNLVPNKSPGALVSREAARPPGTEPTQAGFNPAHHILAAALDKLILCLLTFKMGTMQKRLNCPKTQQHLVHLSKPFMAGIMQAARASHSTWEQ